MESEMIKVIKNRRTVRTFTDRQVDDRIIKEIINCARLAPYPGNVQPLKFAVIKNKASEIFKYTKWAAYLNDFNPSEKEMPPAYIVTLGDKSIKKTGDFSTESAIAGAVMSVAAEALGIGACWLGAIDRKSISKILSLPEQFELLYLLAIGYSDQTCKCVDSDGDIKYYFDENGTFCVPKRKFDDIFIKVE